MPVRVIRLAFWHIQGKAAIMANLTKLAGASALAALLASAPALAQEAWNEGWDANGDAMLSMDEFREGFRQRINLADWDLDADGLISEDEFGTGIYSRYDADVSEGLEETEYGAFERDFGDEGLWGEEAGVTDVETVASDGVLEEDGIGEDEVALGGDELGYEAWDVDGDGVLLRNEFEDGFREWGTFGEFDVDADGSLTEDEITDGIFAGYDEDGTGFIEEPELTDIGDDMGDEGFWDV